jgi:hypothetical protein
VSVPWQIDRHAMALRHRAEIVDRVSTDVLDLHPDWQNQIWARKAVEDLTWPARALPASTRNAD